MKDKKQRQQESSWISSVTSFFLVCNVAIFMYNAFFVYNQAPLPTSNNVNLDAELSILEQQKFLLDEQIENLKEDLKIALSKKQIETPVRSTINTLKYKREDLVCGIITTAKYHKNRAKSVNETWGKRCGVLLFFDATPTRDLPLVHLPGSEEGSIINEKVFRMFEHVWKTHPDKKWFIKADDDTYLHLDNILDMLSEYNHTDPHYIGRAGEYGRGDSYVRYCGGGAGYILSQKALESWSPKIKSCQRLPVGEDVSVGKCLRDSVAITPTFKTGFYHKLPNFFFTNPIGQRDHPEGLSPRPLSFHSVPYETMYEVDYLVHTINQPLNEQWKNPWPTGIPTH